MFFFPPKFQKILIPIGKTRETYVACNSLPSSSSSPLLAVLVKKVQENDIKLIPLHSVVNVKNIKQCSCEKGILCSSPGKHPLFQCSWDKVASNTDKDIKNWLDASKEIFNDKPNFGVLTGRLSNITKKYLVVVDIDKEDHEILRDNRLLPKTFSYRTGKRGHHFWYWSKIQIPNSVRRVAEFVDIRGTNGYVVVPPSKHILGTTYDSIKDNEIADITPELLEKALKGKSKEHTIIHREKHALKEDFVVDPAILCWSKSSIRELRHKMEVDGEVIPKGTRNNTLLRLLCSDYVAGTVYQKDLREKASKYRSFMEESSSFSDEELEKIVNNVQKYRPKTSDPSKVNEIYIKWLKKHGPEDFDVNNEPSKIDRGELKFFDKIEPFKGKKKIKNALLVPLSKIAKARVDYLKSLGHKYIANFTVAQLGMQLKQLGYEVKHTNKGNLWGINLKRLYKEIALNKRKYAQQIKENKAYLAEQEKKYLERKENRKEQKERLIAETSKELIVGPDNVKSCETKSSEVILPNNSDIAGAKTIQQSNKETSTSSFLRIVSIIIKKPLLLKQPMILTRFTSEIKEPVDNKSYYFCDMRSKINKQLSHSSLTRNPRSSIEEH